MMIRKPACLALAFLLLFCAQSWGAETEKIIFCESLGDSYEPINPGEKFTGPVISWVASRREAFGKPTLLLSLYSRADKRESLVGREKVEINPAWNTFAIRNMPVPAIGDYSLSLTTETGEPVAAGTFSIVSMDSQKKAAPEEKMGTTLKDLFNKYSNHKKQEN